MSTGPNPALVMPSKYADIPDSELDQRADGDCPKWLLIGAVVVSTILLASIFFAGGSKIFETANSIKTRSIIDVPHPRNPNRMITRIIDHPIRKIGYISMGILLKLSGWGICASGVIECIDIARE